MKAEKKGCCVPAGARPIGTTRDTVSNRGPGGIGAPPEMIALPGGRFRMGTDFAEGFPGDGEGPVRSVVLSPFSIDTVPVTNTAFHAFAGATGYVTDAERFGWSFVFWAHLDKARYAQLVNDTVAAAPWWCKVDGASWSAPEGPGSHVRTRADHPVVHVSFADASAYAAWSGQQLPTEAEWEYAARGGLEQMIYPWGNDLEPGGNHRCNVWQGRFPTEDTAEDGFAGTCPVKAFPANGYEIYSMTGNTWEWMADWFGTQHPRQETTNPRGPKHGTGKVMKGGSFLCHASYCNRYRVAARTQNTPDSSSSNIGFRCVRRG